MKPWFVVACSLLLAIGPTQAQTAWRDVAVPYYTPPDLVTGQLQHASLPSSRAFAQAAHELHQSLAARGCSSPESRPRFVAALLAWDRLSSIAVGPLLEHRSPRRIDFAPTRPQAIESAIRGQPRGEAAMERIGSAAKGLPALEWLLFQRADKGGEACRYAVEIAADIEREAQALVAGFEAQLAQPADDERAVAAMSEAVNQWIGGLEQLRMQGIERPLGDARARGLARPRFARDASGASLDERLERWQALRKFAVHEGRLAPPAGAARVPLEPYLRGKGLNPLADRLVAAVRGVDAAIANPARLKQASKALAALSTLAQGQVAAALDIRIGFSDADGD